MINNIENKIDIDEDIIEGINKNNKEAILNELRIKYDKLINNKYENKNIKEIKFINNVMENSFSVDKFKNYIDNDFLDNCEYKYIFMPEEFNMKEDRKFYFQGFGEKKKRKIMNLKNKNNVNKNSSAFEAKKNKKKYD